MLPCSWEAPIADGVPWGRKPFAVERVDWTGKVPFEILEMKAKPDGFELVFTEEVDLQSVESVESYKWTTRHLHLSIFLR